MGDNVSPTHDLKKKMFSQRGPIPASSVEHKLVDFGMRITEGDFLFERTQLRWTVQKLGVFSQRCKLNLGKVLSKGINN